METSLHIAYLTGEYPRATDTFIQREVAALRDRGLEVSTFSVRRTGSGHMVGPEQLAERDGTFYVLPVRLGSLVAAHARLVLSPRRYLKALGLAWATRQPGLRGFLYQVFYFAEAGVIAQEIRNRGICHLHNHFANSSCSVAMLAAELGGFSFSFTMHGPAIFFEPMRWRIDEKIRRARFVCCISQFCRSQGMIFAPPEAWSRMHVVHCGVDPSLFPLSAHQGPGWRLLYVGRLAATKGLPVLFEAVARLTGTHPKLRLALVGDGPDRRYLEQLAVRLGIESHVAFYGYQSQTRVREMLGETDVFVLPSFAEGVPVVLMEAMAAGVPVVATRVAGVGELVDESINGLLIPPGDSDSLSNQIETLLTDGVLRARFSQAARRKVECEFNIHREAEKLHEILLASLRPKSLISLRAEAASRSS